jgi:hypothetical protein
MLGANKRDLKVDTGGIPHHNLCRICPFAVNLEDENPLSASYLLLGDPLPGPLPKDTTCNLRLAHPAAGLGHAREVLAADGLEIVGDFGASWELPLLFYPRQRGHSHQPMATPSAALI